VRGVSNGTAWVTAECPGLKDPVEVVVVDDPDATAGLGARMSGLEPDGGVEGTRSAETASWVEVRRIASPAELPLVKTILEERGLPYFLQGENAFNVHPAAIEAILLVPEEVHDEVLEALADLG